MFLCCRHEDSSHSLMYPTIRVSSAPEAVSLDVYARGRSGTYMLGYFG